MKKGCHEHCNWFKERENRFKAVQISSLKFKVKHQHCTRGSDQLVLRSNQIKQLNQRRETKLQADEQRTASSGITRWVSAAQRSQRKPIKTRNNNERHLVVRPRYSEGARGSSSNMRVKNSRMPCTLNCSQTNEPHARTRTPRQAWRIHRRERLYGDRRQFR